MKAPAKVSDAEQHTLVTEDSLDMIVGGALLVVFAVQFLALFG